MRYTRRPRRTLAPPRAFALGSVLMLVAVAAMIGFTTVALIAYQMSLGLRQTTSHAVLNVAESALSVARARLVDSSCAFGTLGSEEVQVSGPGGEVGIVTFVQGRTFPQQGRALPVGWSTHNYTPQDLTAAKPGFNRSVPRDCVHLVATGIGPGGAVRSVEALIHVPPFRFALATTGPLQLRSSTVAGVRNPSLLPRDDRGSPVVSESNMAAGNVGSNGHLLLQRSRVKGDAQAAGSLALSDSVVEGESRSQASPLKLPTFNFEAFDPGARTVCRDLGERFDEGHLNGNARREGSLLVGGDLTLDDALLYVNGDLTVQGGIRGTGAVVVRGNVRLAGVSNVEASAAAALLAEGAVTIAGDGIFQGLVYCTGAFHADHVTIVGSLIQNGAADVSAELNEVHLYLCATGATVKLFVPGSMLFSAASTNFWSQTRMTNQGKGPWEDPENTSPSPSTAPPPTISSLAYPPGNLSGEALTDYLHEHTLFTVTKRDGRLIYSKLWRGRSMDGKSDMPAVRMLQPKSPWETYSTTEMPGRVISIYENPDLDGLLEEFRPHWV